MESGPHRWRTAWPATGLLMELMAVALLSWAFSLCSGFPTGRIFFRKLLGFLHKLDSVDAIQQGQ